MCSLPAEAAGSKEKWQDPDTQCQDIIALAGKTNKAASAVVGGIGNSGEDTIFWCYVGKCSGRDRKLVEGIGEFMDGERAGIRGDTLGSDQNC